MTPAAEAARSSATATGGPAPNGTTGPASSASTGGPSVCPALPAADTASVDGWLGYLAAHPEKVAVIVDDGRGTAVSHRAAEAQPAASAAKLGHLAAYAQAVDAGTLDPGQPVTVGEWERWYLPGLDGGAHPAALNDLGVALDPTGRFAADPASSVTIDDLARAMIEFSDNAAADLLRDRLGDDALRAVFGTGVALPSFLGAQILLLEQRPASPDGEAELAAAQRFSAESGERERVRALPVPPLDTQLAWAEDTATATAAGLAQVATTLSAAADDPDRPGSRLARRHLEWPPVPDGAAGLGAKGGSLPGVLTETFVLRDADGTVGTAVLMVDRMDPADWTTAVGSFTHQELLLQALRDPDTLNRLDCALSAS